MQRVRATANRPATAASLVAAVVAVVYAQTAGFGFVSWDDPFYVVNNAATRSGLGWPALHAAFASFRDVPSWHPLTMLSHALDVQMFGLAPAGHHLVNVGLHLANSLILLAFLIRLSGSPWRSLLVAVLFAVHPLHVESVAWVTGRKDVLSTLFLLLTLWAHVRWVRTRTLALYGLTVAAFTLAALSKSSVVTIPALLLLLDVWVLGRLPAGVSWRNTARRLGILVLEKAPLLPVGLGVTLANACGHARWGGVVSLDTAPLGLRLASVATNYGAYLVKTLWPADLVFFYPGADDVSALSVLAGLALLGACTAVAVAMRRSRPLVLVGWLWFLVAFLPVIGLARVGNSTFNDRFTYVPLIGLFIVLAWGVPWSWRVGRLKPLPVLAAAACAALTGAATLQAAVWKDDVALYGHALAVDGTNFMAHAMLAERLLEDGRLDEAEAQADMALRSNPRWGSAMLTLGKASYRRGRYPEAVRHFHQATEAGDGHYAAWFGLGTALVAAGDAMAGAEALEKAVALQPDDAEGHNNLSVALLRLGRWDDARVHLEAALLLDAGNAAARYNLAQTLERLGQAEAAMDAYERLLEQVPTHREAHRRLAALLLRTGQQEKAAEHLAAAQGRTSH